ncbi:hypothetical protein B1H38_00880 [Leptospira borgpetersenii serovar Ballum]|nr:hypothetical protein B1H38_00880 [Leptospira borgpetersenii serovar Ballum]
MDLKINLSEFRQIHRKTYTPPAFWVEGRGGGKTREVFFTTKSYFLQVKNLILVGTLQKCQFLILMIPKAFLICG